MSNMNDQLQKEAANVMAWAKTHPVIACVGAACAVLLLMGLFR